MSHLKYLWYVLRHKWYVFKVAWSLGIPLLGIIHDVSKFLPDEWFPYTRYFYGGWYPTNAEMPQVYRQCPSYTGPTKEDIKDDFNLAWLKHLHRNKHHWQQWILVNDMDGTVVLQMPEKYMKEMLADWIGAGLAQGHGNDVKQWFINHSKGIQLHHDTRAWIEEQLGVTRHE